MHLQRTLTLFSALSFGTLVASAQDVTEAYNISNNTVQGTARSMGFGNALGSIGGDYSTASVNPAGLGIYRTSELTFTPAMRLNASSSAYLGVVTNNSNVRFNLNNFGMVFTDAPRGKRYERRKWKAVSFAFGMNRVADFNTNYSYSGVNRTSSASQAFEADANHYPDDPGSDIALSVPGYIGYWSYVLEYDTVGNAFYSVVPFSKGVKQDKTVKQRGKVVEYALSLGGNYQEKLMLGATLGIPSVRYSITSTFSEELAPGNNAANPFGFTSFRHTQQLDVKGSGVNLKLGGIYKVNDNVRVGAAFHTPSVIELTEVYDPSISSIVGNINYDLTTTNGKLASNTFNYSLITPWRGILSASFVFKGKGFITADYEYVGYNTMGYIYPLEDGNGNSYAQAEYDMNQAISNTYTNTSNVRLGAEVLLTKYFMARAGFGYYSNPYKASNMNGQRMDFSGGLGFREKDFFADIALVHSQMQLQGQPYSIDYKYVVTSPKPAEIPTATTDIFLNNIALTVGVKF